jgi:hypothetical protein
VYPAEAHRALRGGRADAFGHLHHEPGRTQPLDQTVAGPVACRTAQRARLGGKLPQRPERAFGAELRRGRQRRHRLRRPLRGQCEQHQRRNAEQRQQAEHGTPGRIEECSGHRLLPGGVGVDPRTLWDLRAGPMS